jgi:hypothetical protein
MRYMSSDSLSPTIELSPITYFSILNSQEKLLLKNLVKATVHVRVHRPRTYATASTTKFGTYMQLYTIALDIS